VTVSFYPTTHRPRSHSRAFALCRLLPPNIAMCSSTITPSSPLDGSCFCGAVKYALSAPPVLRALPLHTMPTINWHFPFSYSDAYSQTFCVQVVHSSMPCTSPRLPSRVFMIMMPPLTPSSTHSDLGRHAPAATWCHDRFAQLENGHN